MGQIRSVNPATGAILQTYDEHSPKQAAKIIDRAYNAFLQWKRSSFDERSQCLRKMALVLRERSLDLSWLMVSEMGKPIKEARAEIEKCAACCVYYADNGPSFLDDELIITEARSSYASFQPLGVVLAVMPWNFPFWQLFRFLAPALLAGNTAVLKHASNVPGCALAIEEVVRSSGFPEDVFHTLLLPSSGVEALLEHRYIKAVTLTGSTNAGSKIAAKAGSLIKKAVLELGGSDPYIILEDADLEAAAEICAASRLINSGQSCIAAKRFIVVGTAAEPFAELLREKMAARKLGDPSLEETDIGPQARKDLRDALHEQVTASIAKGARVVLGGEFDPASEGAYYPATILTGVSKGMPAYDEELFGPVAAVISVPDEAAAIARANDSVYGLGSAVFSKDVGRAEFIARNLIEAGSAFVNASVRSDPRLPFGGVKSSGYGRELSSFGIREFVNIKTVYVT